jgi:hypothetical protein
MGTSGWTSRSFFEDARSSAANGWVQLLRASLDERWRGVAGTAFVAAASDAARVAGFGALQRAHGGLLAQVEVALAREAEGFTLAWYERFFGIWLPARLRVVASLHR